MNIIPVSDQSPEVLHKIISEQFTEDIETTLNLLQKVRNPFLIWEGNSVIGYLNLKQVGKTIHIPIYLRIYPTESGIIELVEGIKGILHDSDYKYFVIVMRRPMPSLLNSFMRNIQVEDTVCYYRRDKNFALFALEESEYRWVYTIDNVMDLIEIHHDAYAYEKEYVIGTWDNLIKIFLSSQTPKIMVYCYADDRLIGCALGYVYDSYTYIYSICVVVDYQSKGVCSGLMRRFINESHGKPIELNVYSTNEHAVAIYEHFGFVFKEISTLVGINESG
ncbi:hypothetical protein MASR2M64_06640 [Candidatus Cloacimonadota bacterium]